MKTIEDKIKSIIEKIYSSHNLKPINKYEVKINYILRYCLNEIKYNNVNISQINRNFVETIILKNII